MIVIEILILFFTSLFAGAALHITLVEHPVRNELPIDVAVKQFGLSYSKAMVYQLVYVQISFV